MLSEAIDGAGVQHPLTVGTLLEEAAQAARLSADGAADGGEVQRAMYGLADRITDYRDGRAENRTVSTALSVSIEQVRRACA